MTTIHDCEYGGCGYDDHYYSPPDDDPEGEEPDDGDDSDTRDRAVGPCQGRGCDREETPQAGALQPGGRYLCAGCLPNLDFAPMEEL